MSAAMTPGTAGGGGSLRSHARRRPRATFFGVLGEILITLGIITLLYVAWQLWIGDMIYAAERNSTGQEISQQWASDYLPVPEATAATPTPEPSSADPIALPEPADAEVFGIMHIPRFGADYQVPIAGGVSRPRTLDPIGIGHYPGTVMPGQLGNFALAAHRTTWGKPFNRIAELHAGDAIIVETAGGWYTYRFRTLEYVTPSAVEVLLPVPQVPYTQPAGRYMTMTSCSPMYSMTERIVGYSVFESFTPRAAGPPASLTGGITT